MSRTNVLLVAILCCILGANVGLTQGLYVTASAGYGFGAGTQVLGNNTTITQTSAIFEGVYGSYGEGFKFGTSAGYMFNKNLGAELGLAYWLGNTLEMQTKTPGVSVTAKSSGSGFVGVPSIVLAVPMGGVSPYARLGLVLGIMTAKQETRIEEPSVTEYTIEETGHLAFGYAGAFGILIPAGGIMDFFAEATLHSVNYSPAQRELSKYTFNGVDRLPTIDDKVIDYRDSFDSGETSASLAVRRPFGSIGMTVGVRINL